MRLYRMVLIILLFGLLGHAGARAAQSLQLEAREGYFQFPFFDTRTPVWSYNDQIPGPLIRGRVGTTMVIDFANRLKEPSSIHWHGLRIENAMDGVPGVTQDPVGPGENFIYRLKLEDAGTFWYHPHFNSSEQLERGLKGVFIVEEAEKQPWSQDWVWLMDDWLLQKDGTIYSQFNTGRDLNAVRGGKFGIGWTMNRKLWPDADKAGYRLGVPQKVTFKNSSSRLHPMHIHGVFFRVLERNGKKAVEPFTRDTVLVGPRESVTIGFVPEHPGIWLTHCHIQEHAEAGMMTTIDVKN